MDILLTVTHEDGSVAFNKTLKSDFKGQVSNILKNLKPADIGLVQLISRTLTTNILQMLLILVFFLKQIFN